MVLIFLVATRAVHAGDVSKVGEDDGLRSSLRSIVQEMKNDPNVTGSFLQQAGEALKRMEEKNRSKPLKPKASAARKDESQAASASSSATAASASDVDSRDDTLEQYLRYLQITDRQDYDCSCRTISYKNLDIRSCASSLDGLEKLPGIQTVYRLDVWHTGNPLKPISQKAFSQLSGLTVLEIHTALSGFEKDVFLGTPYLEKLDLARCSLTKFPPIMCLRNLREAHLHQNDITEVPDLSAMSNLRDLWLFNNKITHIVPKHFALPSIEALHLSQNPLKIEPGMFQCLSKLYFLHLREVAGVRVLTPAVFGALQNIRHLDLEGSGLQTIEPGSFAPHEAFTPETYKDLPDLRHRITVTGTPFAKNNPQVDAFRKSLPPHCVVLNEKV